ncbi:hypothetical protein MXD62_19960 [Frankia sp. Mgl5]|uniref:hypothetical protein n=1 Tax=Frankia sp. Mgl5 TaxID=2933793 RepID=UPI00200DD35D|nr:hypothetical protein [Frankia sp. Mgl5]MCK9929427.1 hypothetical protein [Frankia sp. Mgl5]
MRTRRPPSRLAARTARDINPRWIQRYEVHAPLGSHWRHATCKEVDCRSVRPARCEEVDCPNYHNGWRTIVPDGAHADLARTSGRQFIELPAEGGLIEFRFGPGQQCFARHAALGGPCPTKDKHLVQLGKPGLYVLRQGDRRFGNAPVRQFTGRSAPEDWRDHFSEHQEKVQRARENAL